MPFRRYTEILQEIRELLETDAQALELIATLEDKLLELPPEKVAQKKEQKKKSKKKQLKDKVFPLPKEMENLKAYEGLALFCDGGCRGNPGPGAWGAMGQLANGEIFFESSGVEFSTTNNRMELMGAIASLQAVFHYVEEKKWGELPRVFVYSDSRYVVDGMTSWIKQWKARGWKKADNKAPDNLDLWQELDQLSLGLPQLKFLWVKGHEGHPQNEYVDSLANQAMDDAL